MAKRPASSSFLTALRAASDGLRTSGTPSAIIGGVAVIAQGVPRFTADIDAAIVGADLDLEWLLAHLRRHGFVPRLKDAARFARAHQVLLLQHRQSKVDLDLSMAWLDFELRAIARAESIAYGDVPIKAVGAEDLVIYKLIAHRPVDLQDAERLLLLHRKAIDTRRVRAVLSSLAEVLDDVDRVATLDDLLRKTRPIRRGR